MAQANLPITITYDTEGVTPISDVITALQAADSAIQDAVSLLPSFVDGLNIQSSSINVRSLTQESTLRELFLVSLILAFQDDLQKEITPMIEDIFKVEINDKYDTILTVVTMIVLFYGVSLLKDLTVKAAENGIIKRQLNEIIEDLAVITNKTADEVRKTLDAKYNKPNSVKRLANTVKGFFIPAQREGAKAVTFDRKRIEPEFIREIPYPEQYDEKEDFQKFESHVNVTLEVHAQDRDKQNTGWAAVPKGIFDQRLKMKLIEPVTSQDIWNQDVVSGDITIISKLGADGYVPSEIHLTSINTP